MTTRFQISAGGVIYRKNERGETEVALIAVGDRWTLPKGHVEKQEALMETALREVREETGLEAEIVTRLTPIEYWYWWEEEGKRVRYHKKVYYFLMAWRGGDISLHDAEVDAVAWVPIDEAIQRATHRTERLVLQEAKRYLRELETPEA